jgi:myo-inositol-1(or 4)-monophosphatase
MRNNHLDNSLKIAITSAKLAGKFLNDQYSRELDVVFDEGRDIKLQIDRDAEEIISNYLSSNSDLPIMGEEFGASSELGKDYWIIDPLDGTSNFFRNIPICAVSIAMIKDNIPVIGVIYDFLNKKIYSASKDGGAFCNNELIQTSKITDKKKGTLVTGIPARESYSEEDFRNIISHFQDWKKVRMIGSAAIANILVATGSAEVYKEDGIFFWDVAAGSVIVQEAGGLASITNIQDDYRVDAEFTNGNF